MSDPEFKQGLKECNIRFWISAWLIAKINKYGLNKNYTVSRSVLSGNKIEDKNYSVNLESEKDVRIVNLGIV